MKYNTYVRFACSLEANFTASSRAVPTVQLSSQLSSICDGSIFFHNNSSRVWGIGEWSYMATGVLYMHACVYKMRRIGDWVINDS